MTHTIEPKQLSAQAIANFFLDKAEEEGVVVDPLKLIKLVYIAYGWYLAATGERLFLDRIEAWRHGPVIPSLYHEFKHYRRSQIPIRATIYDFVSGAEAIPRVSKSNKAVNLILEKVWAVYKHFGGWSLRGKTHESETPWAKVYEEGMNKQLRDEDISEHYIDRLKRYVAAAHE